MSQSGREPRSDVPRGGPTRHRQPARFIIMLEELPDLDVSHLDSLARLEADASAIKELLDKAARRRQEELDMYARVMGDYQARLSTLLEQATALRQQLRKDLPKVEAIYDRCRVALDKATVQLKECEFRYGIGEFTAADFQRCQQAARQAIAEREAEFESIRNLWLRYTELLSSAPASHRSAAHLQVPSVSPPTADTAEDLASAPAVAETGQAEAPAAEKPAPAAGPVAGEPSGRAEEPTRFWRPSATDFKAPSEGKAVGQDEAFGTIALSSAMLIEDRGGLPGAHFRLGLLTMIGRTADNQIVVPSKAVSRQHASIAVSNGAYVVRDLDTPNGTFVNDERISEHRLKDGDKITIGEKAFVFKL